MTTAKIILCWLFLFQRLLAVPISPAGWTTKADVSSQEIQVKDDLSLGTNELQSILTSAENKSTEDVKFEQQGFINSLGDLLKEESNDILLQSFQEFLTKLKNDRPLQSNLPPKSENKDVDVVSELEELKSPLNPAPQDREESREVAIGSTLLDLPSSQPSSTLEKLTTESSGTETFPTTEEEAIFSTQTPPIMQSTEMNENDIFEQIPRALLNWLVMSEYDHEMIAKEYEMLMKMQETLKDVEEKLSVVWKPKRRQEISVSESLQLREVVTDGSGLPSTPDTPAADTLGPDAKTSSFIVSNPSEDSPVTILNEIKTELSRTSSEESGRNTFTPTSSQIQMTTTDNRILLSSNEKNIAKEEKEEITDGGESKELLDLHQTNQGDDKIENELKQAKQGGEDNLVLQLNRMTGKELAKSDQEETQGNETVNKSRTKGRESAARSYKDFPESVEWLKEQYGKFIGASTTTE